MKIKVPTFVTQFNLSDRELVFCNLMGFFAQTGWIKHRYYMWSDDIKHILGITQKHKSRQTMISLSNHLISKEFNNIRKVFRMGTINNPQWFVQFPTRLSNEYINGNGSLSYVDVEINDIEAIKVYFYLVGRISGTEEIMTDEVKLIKPEDATPDKSSVLKRFYREHVMI